MNEPAGVWKYIRGLERLSLCDWPGRTCCVLFLGGCNLRCPTCHNGTLAWNMDSLPVIPHRNIKAFLAERRRWLEGVTITGGEPTTVPGVGELLWEIKKLGLPVKMDSNGMRPKVIRELLSYNLVDKFAVDVKGPYAKYPKLTGNAVEAYTAKENLEEIFSLARKAHGNFYFRLTKVPGISNEDIKTARRYLPSGFSLTLQEYVPPRRDNAETDNEKGRPVRDLVH